MINLPTDYYTTEELQRKEQISAKMDAVRAGKPTLIEAYIALGLHATIEEMQQKAGYTEEYSQLAEEYRNIDKEAAARYEKRSNRQIIADTKTILRAAEKEDYLETLAKYIQKYNTAVAIEKSMPGTFGQGDIEGYRQEATEGYTTAYSFLQGWAVSRQLAVLENHGAEKALAEARELVRQKALEWYTERPNTLAPYLQISFFNDIAFMNRKQAATNAYTGAVQLTHANTTLVLGENGHYTVSLHKLLVASLIAFTRQNGRGKNEPVTIPTKWYLKMLGFDFTPHETSTPEEAAKENKRLRDMRSRARKEVIRDLVTLRGSYLLYDGKDREEVNILSGYKLTDAWDDQKIEESEIKIVFDEPAAKFLIKQGTISYFPLKLFSVSERMPNTYKIGVKLSLHWNMDNNRKRGTYNIISVKKLLEVTELPTYDHLRETKHSRHWEELIKEPFEKALDDLYSMEILANWEYSPGHGLSLPDAEAESIADYATFSGLYLLFEMRDTLNPAARIEKKQEAQKKKKESAERRKQKRIATASDRKELKKIVKEVAEELEKARHD